MSGGLLIVVGALAAAGQVIDLAFLPEDAALPPVVVRVEQSGAARAVAWVVAATPPTSGVRADQRGAERSLLSLPQPPAGAALVDDGTVLVVTIDDAGDWARRFIGASGNARARVAGVSVAGDRALRLVLPALGAPPGPAALVGAQTRVAGWGVALPATSSPRALLRAGAELLVAQPMPVDGAAACGAVAAASWSSDRPPLRLLASGSPVCVGTVTVARVGGVRVGPRLDQPVIGVLISAAP